MFGALKRGFRSLANLILVVNVVGELQPKRKLAASCGFLAAARLSCSLYSNRRTLGISHIAERNSTVSWICVWSVTYRSRGRYQVHEKWRTEPSPRGKQAAYAETLFRSEIGLCICDCSIRRVTPANACFAGAIKM